MKSDAPEWSDQLTAKEAALFEKLAAARGRIVSRDDLHAALYWNDPDGGPDMQIINAFVMRLRRKCPWPIRTHYGRGFSLHTIAAGD